MVYGLFMLAFAKEYFIVNAHTLEKFLLVFWAHYQVFTYIHPIGTWWQKMYLRTNEVGVDVNRALASPYAAPLVQFVCGLGVRKATALLKTLKQTSQRLANRTELVTDCHRLDGEKRPATRALLDYRCFQSVPDL